MGCSQSKAAQERACVRAGAKRAVVQVPPTKPPPSPSPPCSSCRTALTVPDRHHWGRAINCDVCGRLAGMRDEYRTCNTCKFAVCPTCLRTFEGDAVDIEAIRIKRMEDLKKRLSYDGWQYDFDQCQKAFFRGDKDYFDVYFKTCEEQQQKEDKAQRLKNELDEHRPAPLVKLDQTAEALTYTGHATDVKEAEDDFIKKGGDKPELIDRAIEMMLRKQKHEEYKERNHPTVSATSSNRTTQQQDQQQQQSAKRLRPEIRLRLYLQHYGRSLRDSDLTHRLEYYLFELPLGPEPLSYSAKRLQQAQNEHRAWERELLQKKMTDVQSLLELAKTLDYDNCEEDVRKAKESFVAEPNANLNSCIQMMRKKQAEAEGARRCKREMLERRRPLELIELDNLVATFTYPECEADARNAEETFLETGELWDTIGRMQRKQLLHKVANEGTKEEEVSVAVTTMTVVDADNGEARIPYGPSKTDDF